MKKIDKIHWVIIAIFILSILGLIGFFWIYKSIFDGELSEKASDWAAFGSYFGGVAGPLVGLSSLGGVLITVILQKRLLSQQMDEFKKLHSQQEKTLALTKEQVRIQSSQHESEKVERVRERLLKVVGYVEKQNQDFLHFKEEVLKSDIRHQQSEYSRVIFTETEIAVKIEQLNLEFLKIRASCSELEQELIALSVSILSTTVHVPHELEEKYLGRIREAMKRSKEIVTESRSKPSV